MNAPTGDPSTFVHLAQASANVTIGTVVAIEDAGQVWVDFPRNPDEDAQLARCTSNAGAIEVGAEVLLVFVDGNLRCPIITGILNQSKPQASTDLNWNIQKEGHTLRIRGDQTLVLECGKAKITLTQDGKLTLRGIDILSRASGTQRIRGGSVRIN